MTKDTNGNGPELIVLGRDEAGKPQAARFPASQSDLATKAAKAMNLVVGKADGPALAELADKLPTGRLYATGRGFVPPVRRNLYDKIVEQLKLASAGAGTDRCLSPRCSGFARQLGQDRSRPDGDRR
jgi:hypothetical protein